MKTIQNEYNEQNFQTFRKIAELGFAIQRACPRDAAARVIRLGEIGPNGIVRMHFRQKTLFSGKTAVAKDYLAQMLALADDFSVSATDDGLEMLVTCCVIGVVTNFDAQKVPGVASFYRSPQEIE